MTGWTIKKEISIGNILTILMVVGGAFTWVITVETRLVGLLHADQALSNRIEQHGHTHE